MSNPVARSFRASLFLLLLATLTLSACSAAAVAAESDSQPPAAGAGGGSQPAHPGDDPLPVEPDFPIGGPVTQPVEPDFPLGGPVEPLPDGNEPTDGAIHVVPSPDVVNALPHAIDHISVAADGRTVTVYWWGGVEDCYGLADVLVQRDANGALVITVLEGQRDNSADGVEKMCIELAMLKATTITLDEPLFLDGSQS